MTNEQNERLKQIRERRHAATLPANQRGLLHTASWVDIDFLLSLLDSQGTYSLNEGGKVRSVSATTPEAAIVMGHVIAHNRNAAFRLGGTAMRSRCAEKMEDYRQRIQYESDEGMREALFGQMIIEMESLTLDQVEQEKPR